jgi:hypothetical protein
MRTCFDLITLSKMTEDDCSAHARSKLLFARGQIFLHACFAEKVQFDRFLCIHVLILLHQQS